MEPARSVRDVAGGGGVNGTVAGGKSAAAALLVTAEAVDVRLAAPPPKIPVRGDGAAADGVGAPLAGLDANMAPNKPRRGVGPAPAGVAGTVGGNPAAADDDEPGETAVECVGDVSVPADVPCSMRRPSRQFWEWRPSADSGKARPHKVQGTNSSGAALGGAGAGAAAAALPAVESSATTTGAGAGADATDVA